MAKKNCEDKKKPKNCEFDYPEHAKQFVSGSSVVCRFFGLKLNDFIEKIHNNERVNQCRKQNKTANDKAEFVLESWVDDKDASFIYSHRNLPLHKWLISLYKYDKPLELKKLVGEKLSKNIFSHINKVIKKT